jgi:receptor protein-tyrosine kinase
LVTLGLPSVYEANVALLVRPAQPLSVDPGVAALTSDQISKTYATLMTEPPLLQRVISDLQLKMDVATLSREIKVTPETGTTILDVAVDDRNPADARNIANTLTTDFVVQIKEIQQGESKNPTASSADNLVVVSPATLPVGPIFPRPLLNIGLAIFAGILLGLALAFLLDYLDQSIRSDDLLIERVGLTPIGHIAWLAPKPERRSELVALQGSAPVAEAYKALRTNLLFSSVDKEVKTIVVTSASPGEGKSRTAANLSLVLAQAGHETLLVDADFRRPSQHRLFGRVRNLGLSNMILQDLPDAELLQADEAIPNLTVLLSGPTPPNPSELLGSGAMKSLLARFRKSFAYVILDTPPIHAVTDALVLAAAADATILVVEAKKTTYPSVIQAKASLQRVGASILGVVMNKIRAAGGSSYYYNQYGYGYESSPRGSSVPEGSVPGKALMHAPAKMLDERPTEQPTEHPAGVVQEG